MNELFKNPFYQGSVDANYCMNPDTEKLIYADRLKNGMVVLLNPSSLSFATDHDSFVHPRSVTHRWCEITQIRNEDYAYPLSYGADVYFIGVYADGQEAVRHSSACTGWLVKKSTIPDQENNLRHIPTGLPRLI